MQIYLSLGVAVLGALVYGFATNPKLAEVGRISFFAGLLSFLMTAATHTFSLMR